jgi:uncharacterized protein
MDQRISIVTLGVRDLKRSRKFYESMGWEASEKSQENIVFFQLGVMAVALYPWGLLAEDAKQNPSGSGFPGFTLAYNVRDKASVVSTLKQAEAAGAKILKPAQDVFWGGHSGYFSDPDGHLWEVAWNPYAELGSDGSFRL